MMLLVDIGNARIKWAAKGDGGWHSGEPLQYRDRAFKDVARPAWKDLDAPQRVVVSNVAGDTYAKAVRTWVKRRWRIAPEFLHAGENACGVTNAYAEPARLGADRWAALIGAHSLYPGPVVVIDCGTAVTVDALAADGRHLGGLIVPGMELMINSLVNRAPLVELDNNGSAQVSLLGRSTQAAVTGGILYTIVSLVDRICSDLKAELGRDTAVVLTGGDAPRIRPLLTRRPDFDADLVLKGLAVVAEEAPGALSDL
jgi:type III pantothenate kinase